MNNNDLYTVDFTRSLPPALQHDPKMIALAKAVAEQLTITAAEIRKNIIYARLDELDEQTLDVLAYDLHVDWYDYTYPIEAKRAIIKDSVKVHKRMGTKYAVETALGNIHPNSYIEEWWQYGGEPYYFRVILDTAYSRAPAGYYAVKRAIDKYKRLTAHMESLVYQCGIGLEIHISTHIYKSRSYRAGVHLAGTIPNRNKGGAVHLGGLEIEPDAKGYSHAFRLAGTYPDRNTTGAFRRTGLEVEPDARGFPYSAALTGTDVVQGGIAVVPYGTLKTTATLEGFKYRVKRCGTSCCRT